MSSLAKPQYLFRPGRSASRIAKALYGDRPQRVQVRLPWGVTICIDTFERIGRSIWRSGVHDLAVVEALWRLLDAGDTAVDVGANLGYTTSLMAKRVGPAGVVLCFEPHPAVFDDLEKNIALIRSSSDVGAIHAYRIALSDRVGEAVLSSPGGGSANDLSASRLDAQPASAGEQHATVATRLLDEFAGERQLAVVKIDVEGHELNVLRGAERTLARGGITHIIYEDFGGCTSPVHDLLRSHGYSVHALGWATHKPVLSDPGAGPAVDLTWESPNYLATLAPQQVVERFKRWGWSVI